MPPPVPLPVAAAQRTPPALPPKWEQVRCRDVRMRGSRTQLIKHGGSISEKAIGSTMPTSNSASFRVATGHSHHSADGTTAGIAGISIAFPAPCHTTAFPCPDAMSTGCRRDLVLSTHFKGLPFPLTKVHPRTEADDHALGGHWIQVVPSPVKARQIVQWPTPRRWTRC